jgi:hypothetical protein
MPAPLRELQWSNASEPEWKLWQALWPKEGVIDPAEDEKLYLIDLLQTPVLGNMEGLSYTDEFPALNGRRLLLIRPEYRQLLGKVDNGLDTFRKTILLTGQSGTGLHPPVVVAQHLDNLLNRKDGSPLLSALCVPGPRPS